MMTPSAEPLTGAKMRLVEYLKRVEAATAPELAATFGLTDTAVRQHLEALEAAGLVERRASAAGGRGRPAVRWSLAVPARAIFPDRHGDLTVELIGSIREALGEKALAKVIEARGGHQTATYRSELNRTTSLKARVRRLAELRTAEGYMAEARADGDGYVLVEHHCPVCTAASACPGLCRSELEVFRAVLGPDVEIQREQHLLSGDQRCAYRIRPS
jgi:predicted ArsR family transcriptional regulator